MTPISGIDVPYELSLALQSILAEFARAKRAAKKQSFKFKGRKQSHMTREQELAAARARQYTCHDPNFATPFQMPTDRKPAVFSHALPRYFLNDVNAAWAQLARFDGQMKLVFEKLWQESAEFLAWFPDHLYELATKMKPADRAYFLAEHMAEVVRNASSVFGPDGLPVLMGPADYAKARRAINAVEDFARQAGKYYGFVRDQLQAA